MSEALNETEKRYCMDVLRLYLTGRSLGNPVAIKRDIRTGELSQHPYTGTLSYGCDASGKIVEACIWTWGTDDYDATGEHYARVREENPGIDEWSDEFGKLVAESILEDNDGSLYESLCYEDDE